MKQYDTKLPYGPHHPEVLARVLEMIQSMTPEEGKAFLEYRKPGIPEYWFGKPVPKTKRNLEKRMSRMTASDDIYHWLFYVFTVRSCSRW